MCRKLQVITLLKLQLLLWIAILLSISSYATTPTHTIPFLNTTYGSNTSLENLTAYNISTFDSSGDNVKNIFAWYKNSFPFERLIIPFEAGSTTTRTRDYSGFNSVITVYGSMTWNVTGGYDGFGTYTDTGKTNTSYFLVSANPSISTNLENGFTITGWVKPNKFKTYQTLIGYSGSSIAKNFEWRYNANGTTTFFLTNGTTTVPFTSRTILPTNAWTFVAVRYTKSNNVTLFFNTTQETFLTPFILKTTNKAMYIKSFGSSMMQILYFNATVDDIRIYNTTLSDQQIQLIYQNNTFKIDSSLLSVNSTWRASVTPVDNVTYGTTLNSTILTIGPNYIPVLNAILLNSTEITKSIGLGVNVTFIDENNQIMDIFVDWLRNGSLLYSEMFSSVFSNQNTLVVLNQTYYSRNDTITVSIMAHDQLQSSIQTNSSWIVQDSSPIIFAETNVTIPTKTSGLGIIMSCIDADEDLCTFNVSWIKNEILLYSEFIPSSIEILNTSYYNKNDNITASIVGFDDWLYSSELNLSWTVGNVAPTADFTANTSAVTKTSGIGINVYYTDIDNDIATLFIDWYKNDVLVSHNFSIENNTFFALNSSEYNKSDVITVSVTASDESDNSTGLQRSWTVQNTAPIITVFANESNLTEGSTIGLNITYHDSDDDLGNISITWLRNDSILFTENTPSSSNDFVFIILNSSTYFYGDNLSAFVIAFDGTGDSNSVNYSWIVQQRPVPISSESDTVHSHHSSGSSSSAYTDVAEESSDYSEEIISKSVSDEISDLEEEIFIDEKNDLIFSENFASMMDTQNTFEIVNPKEVTVEKSFTQRFLNSITSWGVIDLLGKDTVLYNYRYGILALIPSMILCGLWYFSTKTKKSGQKKNKKFVPNYIESDHSLFHVFAGTAAVLFIFYTILTGTFKEIYIIWLLLIAIFIMLVLIYRKLSVFEKIYYFSERYQKVKK
ncbi:MAG: LamG domain-containing protein [Candidatus Woesearchaeota archaeon]